MWRSITGAAAITAFCINTAFACVNQIDTYSAGVLFNISEGFAFGKMDSVGKVDINFFRTCSDQVPATGAKPITVIDSVRPSVSYNQFTIKNAAVIGNTLKVEVVYSGGCTTHEFTMYAFNGLSKSLPPIANLVLSHKANLVLSQNENKDNCNSPMAITETLYFDLSSIEKIINGNSVVRLAIEVPQLVDTLYIPTYVQWYTQNNCTIKYRSHYDPSALVTLGYYSLMKTDDKFPNMTITTDSSIKTLVAIDYGKVVTTELNWLVNNGILINFNKDRISSIASKIHRSNSQYWTRQDSVIDFSSLFTYSINTDGTYKWGDVNSINVTRCGETVEFKLPPESIDASPTSILKRDQNSSQNSIFLKAEKGNCRITFDKVSLPNSLLSIIDLNGRVIGKYIIPANSKSVDIPIGKSLAKGMYHAVYRANGNVVTARLIVEE